MIWIIYALVCFGLAFILGFSKITRDFRSTMDHRGGLPRWLCQLLECPACLGWWEGLFCYFVLGFRLPVFEGRFMAPLCMGLFTCATNLVVAKLVRLDDE